MKFSKNLLAVFFTASVLFFGCKPKDSDVQAKITEKFASMPELMGASASVTDGVATLTGEVKDDATKEASAAKATAVKGVKSVVNNETITAPPVVAAPVVIAPDDALTTNVKDATKDFPTVTAAVADGVVTLTGTIAKSSLPKLFLTCANDVFIYSWSVLSIYTRHPFTARPITIND